MAIKQNVIDDFNILSGQQKAAILMLSLDEERSASIFALMDDEEIKELSVIMASLGKVNSNVVGHHHCCLPPVFLTENLMNPFPHPIDGMRLAYLSIRKPCCIQGAKYQFLLYTKDLCF